MAARKPPVRRRKGKKRGTIGTVVLGMAVAIMALLEAFTETDQPAAGTDSYGTVQPVEVVSAETSDTQLPDMEVHFLDVGQSDATLVMNGEHAMLIDAGDNNQGTAIQNYLQKQGVEHLDYLILTHTDADHIGGADVIITKFDVDTVFMGNYAKDTATYRDVIQALDNKGLQWSTPAVGENYTLGDAFFTIIAPNKEYNTPNNSSIGLLLTKGKNKFIFTGDAEEAAEADIVQNGIDITADVYQAGHHGSKTASSDALLDAVKPEFAVISCGQDNKYGFPHAQVLNSFRERGIQVFRTDEQGSIVAVSDGTSITWNCAPSESWKAGEPTGSGK